MKPDLLLICPLFPATMAQLDAVYTVHRYDQAADKDVFAAEPKVPDVLLKLDNVVLQPHVSSGTHWTRAAMGQLVVDNQHADKNFGHDVLLSAPAACRWRRSRRRIRCRRCHPR